MVYTVVPDKAAGDAFTEGMWDTYIRDNLNTGVWRPIAETILSASAASISFSSIAADHRHLAIVCIGRTDAAVSLASLLLRFNGDTAGNYDFQELNGNAAAANAGETLATTSIKVGAIPGNSAAANLFGVSVIWIPRYAGTSHEKVVRLASADKVGTASGNLTVRALAGFWRNTAAVTSITLLPASGNLVAGSMATLYGVPGL